MARNFIQQMLPNFFDQVDHAYTDHGQGIISFCDVAAACMVTLSMQAEQQSYAPIIKELGRLTALANEHLGWDRGVYQNEPHDGDEIMYDFEQCERLVLPLLHKIVRAEDLESLRAVDRVMAESVRLIGCNETRKPLLDLLENEGVNALRNAQHLV
ncbi:hypothetical protein [Ferrimonas balearica]|uniref:hypothetical protein n=1 Tax=Ferrimonas balearica TaxID=44012 RepID=UPI001F376A14|nr:hypothetical protein [Ferrimonas balearica]MBY6093829.1 hypothetical protein [Ferrimonas balearica]